MSGVANRIRIVLICLVLILLAFTFASGGAVAQEEFSPLPMDTILGGPAPKDANYLSSTQYEDASISVTFYSGKTEDTVYNYCHVKIVDPSQLRTAPAGMVDSQKATFRSESTARGRYVAKAVNAVVAINGDYHTKTDKCRVVMRQSTQYRNTASGDIDLLLIDKNANFSVLENCTKAQYAAYYEEHSADMYQVFCFGPVLVQDGASVIAEDYKNGSVGAQNLAQRSAIMQIGELEYILITTEGPQSPGSAGLKLPRFASLCEEVALRHSETGAMLAYNLDGGNSSTLIFKAPNEKGTLLYNKVNCPEIERFLSDIIYFATLVY